MQIRRGDKVTAQGKRGVGTVLHHHPTLPAWVVRFGREKHPLAYFEERLAVAR